MNKVCFNLTAVLQKESSFFKKKSKPIVDLNNEAMTLFTSRYFAKMLHASFNHVSNFQF